MPNNNAIFWRNLCKILRLCQDIVLSIVSRLIYHLVIWLSFVWSFGNVLLGDLEQITNYRHILFIYLLYYMNVKF